MRRRLSVLFNHAIENEWAKENPMQAVAALAEPRSSIGILTPSEARKLLQGVPARFAGHLAAALFCGPLLMDAANELMARIPGLRLQRPEIDHAAS